MRSCASKNVPCPWPGRIRFALELFRLRCSKARPQNPLRFRACVHLQDKAGLLFIAADALGSLSPDGRFASKIFQTMTGFPSASVGRNVPRRAVSRRARLFPLHCSCCRQAQRPTEGAEQSGKTPHRLESRISSPFSLGPRVASQHFLGRRHREECPMPRCRPASQGGRLCPPQLATGDKIKAGRHMLLHEHPVFILVRPAGIEPAAYSLGGYRSIQLSYERVAHL